MTTSDIHADGLPVPQRYWAYTTVIITLTLAIMDASVANVALPTIAHDFHATPSDSIAIVSAYQLAIVVLLLPLSALGDIYGYRRIYMCGIVVFTLASLSCACAGSIATLTAARIMQGFGAAGIMSVNTALIRYIFPHSRLGRVLGTNAMIIATASTVGPSFASTVLNFGSWQWLFAVNVPLGIIAFAIGARNLPLSPRASHRFDVLSAILTAAMFGMLITSIESVSRGASLPIIFLQIVIGIIAGIWTTKRQWTKPAPLLPVDLMRVPSFAFSTVTSVCSFTAQMLAFVALPFFMQGSLGYKATTIGFLIMPWPLAVGITAPIVGRLADHYPAEKLGRLGLAIFSIGLIFVALLPSHASPLNIIWRMALCGIGFGLFQPLNNRTLITSAPKLRSGAASGVLGTARLLGQATGAALVALILSHFSTHGAALSLFVGAAFAALAGLISIWSAYKISSTRQNERKMTT